MLVFLRFALGIAVALNSGVDLLFLEQQQQQNDREIERFRENLFSLESDEPLGADSLRGKVLGFWNSLSLDELERRIGEGIEKFINLVAIYLLKTILFPLFFFYGVFYGIRWLWRLPLNPAGALAQPAPGAS